MSPLARCATRSVASKGFVCASIAAASLASAPPALAVDVGAPAPEIGVRDTTGAFISLAELRGNVAIIAFFESSLQSSDDLLAGLERIHERHGHEGVAVIAIGTDVDATTFAEYVSRRPAPYRIAHDGTWGAVDRYRPSALPTVFVLDAFGFVQRVQSDLDPSGLLELDRTVELILRSRGVPPPPAPPFAFSLPVAVPDAGPGAGWIVLGTVTGFFAGALVLGGAVTLACIYSNGDLGCLAGILAAGVGGAFTGAIIGGVGAAALATPAEPVPPIGEHAMRLRVSF